MPFSYNSYEQHRLQGGRRRTALGYWVPLIVTVTVATAGLAIWIWRSRDEPDSSDDENLSYGEEKEDEAGPSLPPRRQDRPSGERAPEDESFVSRMSGAIRRTPSPQQLFDGASRRVVAGVAAAGAAFGGALSSIREENGGHDHFQDHSRWSEEADLKQNVDARAVESAGAVAEHAEAFSASVRQGEPAAGQGQRSLATKGGGRKKSVAVVISAESMSSEHSGAEEQSTYRTEMASLLSHLPPTDHDTTTLFVLIYAPSLKSQPPSQNIPAPPSLGSSYSAISTPAQTPGEELTALDPQPYAPESSEQTPTLSASGPTGGSIYPSGDGDGFFAALRAQALPLVPSAAHILPFTTPQGHVHILRHLGPQLVYLEERRGGPKGQNVELIRAWVGQVIIVVGSHGGGLGGLVDTEDEGEASVMVMKGGERDNWWENPELVGLGKGVEVVDAARVREDWDRRVGGRD